MIREAIDIFSTIFLAVLCFIAAYKDIKTKKVPNFVVITLIVFWIFICFLDLFLVKFGYLDASIEEEVHTIFLNLISTFALTFFIVAIDYVFMKIRHKKPQIGMGDIKLIFAICLYAGFDNTLMVIILSCVFFIIYVLVNRLMKNKKMDRLPFAPFIFCAVVVMIIIKSFI